MKNITYFFAGVVSLFFVSCASSKGDTWVVTQAKGNHFKNQHSNRWYKLDKGTQANVGDSLLVVYGSKTRFEKVGDATAATTTATLNNTVTKNNK